MRTASSPSVPRATRADALRERSDAPARARSAGSRPRGARGRVRGALRTRLGDLTAYVAAGAAAAATVALVALPGLPTGLALSVGALVSLGGGWATLVRWSREAERAGVPRSAGRSQALEALVAAHAVAALPIGLAVLLAG